ncbi:MAG: MFS transporter [Micromonosporaceae bacterium]
MRVEETTDLAAVDTQEWDGLVTAAGAGFYLSHAWLSALHGVDGFAERNLLVRDGAGNLVAGLNLYTIERATNPLYDPHQVLAPDTDPVAWEPQLVIGARSGYSNGILATTDEGYAAVAELATEEATANGYGSAAMMYLGTGDARRMAALITGTVPALTGFRCELPITFDSFDGYLAGLSKNRRKHVHRDLRRFAKSGCRIEITGLEPYVDQLAPLLGNVQRHHGVDIPDELHAGYLRGCARGELAGQAVVFQCFDGDRRIGFTLAYVHQGRLTMRVTGLDYARTEVTGAHFSLLCYAPIRYALQIFMVLYLVHRGFTEAQGGYALGAYGAGAVLGLLFGGGLSDRLGPRLTIAISMGTSAVMVMAVSLLGYYPAILVAVALAGMMTQANRPASAALLTALTPPSRHVMVMAMNRFALNSGIMAGPLVGAWLITISWDLLLWLDGATALAYSLIALFLLPRRETAGKAETEAAAATDSKVGYLTMLRDSRYMLFLAAFFTNALVHVQYYAVLPLWLADGGYPTVVYSTMFLISGALVMTCELWVTSYTQKWRSWLPGSLGLLILSLGLAMFALPGGLLIILAARFLGIAGQIIGAPSIFAWPVKVAPAGAEGRYLGAGMSTFWLGYTLGPMIGVLAYQQIGEMVWWICGGVGLVSTIAAAISMRLPQKSESGSTAAPEVAAARA